MRIKCFLIVFFFVCLLNITLIKGASVNITSFKDSFVLYDQPDTNYGNSTLLGVQSDTSGRQDKSRVLISFNLTDLNINPSQIQQARFWMRVTSSNWLNVRVKPIENDTWNEYTITYNNLTQQITINDTVLMSWSENINTEKWLTKTSTDFSNYIKQEYSKDKTISLFMDGYSTSGLQVFYFRSRENVTFSPFLEIEYCEPVYDETLYISGCYDDNNFYENITYQDVGNCLNDTYSIFNLIPCPYGCLNGSCREAPIIENLQGVGEGFGRLLDNMGGSLVVFIILLGIATMVGVIVVGFKNLQESGWG